MRLSCHSAARGLQLSPSLFQSYLQIVSTARRRISHQSLLRPHSQPFRAPPFTPLFKMIRQRRQSIIIPNQQMSDVDPVPLQEPNLSPPTIMLTKREELIRRILVEAAEHINEELGRGGTVTVPEHLRNAPLVLRFTGGWVRDKILAGKSNDLDVAINKMTGYEFAQKLRDWMELHGQRFKEEYENAEDLDGGEEIRLSGSTDETKFQGSIHKIESNPEKSKHLETATTRLLGLDIDLVNLRSESYSEDSRIPAMEFGTPEEDALRRDATVNALFFNLHTQQIEDFTQCGLEDMRRRIIRTPLEPSKTFEDDPLRILRLIRFASRLDFMINDEVKAAMQEPSIQKALRLKISRERVGIEVEKMLRGRDPRLSLSLIHHLNLYAAIFAPSYSEIPEDLDHDIMYSAANILHTMFTEERWKGFMDQLVTNPEEAYIAWNIAAVLPWQGRILMYKEETVKKTKKEPKPLPATAVVARIGLKAINTLFDIFTVCEKNYVDIQKTMKEATGNAELSRKMLGSKVRQWGATWRLQLLCALLHELSPLHKQCLGKSFGSGSNPIVTDILERYRNFLEAVKKENLQDAHSMKPLLKGNEIAALFVSSNVKGPWLMRVIEAVVEWQFERPEATPEELTEYVKSGALQWIVDEEIQKFEELMKTKKKRGKKAG